MPISINNDEGAITSQDEQDMATYIDHTVTESLKFLFKKFILIYLFLLDKRERERERYFISVCLFPKSLQTATSRPD